MEQLSHHNKSIKSYALTLLARRAYSEEQLRKKLRQFILNNKRSKATENSFIQLESDELNALSDSEYSIIEQTIALCIDHHFIDDQDYVNMLLKSHLSKGDGYFKIQRNLQQKGFSELIIEQALHELNPNFTELALLALNKKFKTQSLDLIHNINDKARCFRFLQSRGFRYDEINEAIALFNNAS